MVLTPHAMMAHYVTCVPFHGQHPLVLQYHFHPLKHHLSMPFSNRIAEVWATRESSVGAGRDEEKRLGCRGGLGSRIIIRFVFQRGSMSRRVWRRGGEMRPMRARRVGGVSG